MKRGDIVVVAPYPPFDKPRPAVILQAQLLDTTETVSMALITSDLMWLPGLRVPVEPSPANGLRRLSDIMIDLLVTVPRARVGGVVGTIEPEVMSQVDRALRLFLGL